MHLNTNVVCRQKYFPLAAALITFCGTADAADCVFEGYPNVPLVPSGPYVPPEVVPQASYTVRGAKEDRPFTMEANAVGALWLTWARYPVRGGPLLEQRLVVKVASSAGHESSLVCETSWLPIDKLPMFGRLKLSKAGVESEPLRWQVSIYERNRSPKTYVTDQDLSTVSVSGKGLRLYPSVDPRPLEFGNVDAVSPGACAVSQTPPSDDAPLRNSMRLPAGTLDTTGFVHLVSGRTVSAVVSQLRSDATVTLKFYAKGLAVATGAKEVCSITLTATDTARRPRVVAAWPLGLARDLRWQIALESSQPSPPVAIDFYSERPTFNPSEASAHAPDVYSCTNARRPSDEPAAAKGKAVFQGAYALSVRTGLKTVGVGEAAYQDIVGALLDAIDLWRSACEKCTPYQFSVVDIDGKVYVPRTMLQGRPGNMRATYQQLYPWSTEFNVGKNVGVMVPVASFIAVDHTPWQRRRFCNQLPEAGSSFSAADSPLCRPTAVSNERERIVNFKWAMSSAPCDGDAGTIACWNGTDTISMNARDYSFYAGEIGSVLLGTAPRQVDLVRVFAHEVGHWLGIGHLRSDGSIMQGQFIRVRCLDDQALNKLNSIAEGAELPSYVPEALKYGD